MDFTKYEREIEEVVRRALRRDMYGYFMKHAIVVLMELDDFIKMRQISEKVERSIRSSLWSCVNVCYYNPIRSFADCWYNLSKSGLTEEERVFVEEFWRYHVENAFKYARALRNYVFEKFKELREHLEPLSPLYF